MKRTVFLLFMGLGGKALGLGEPRKFTVFPHPPISGIKLGCGPLGALCSRVQESVPAAQARAKVVVEDSPYISPLRAPLSTTAAMWLQSVA